MKNWAKNRKLSLAVHLLYILIPALAGVYASVRLWTDVFGDPWFAVPLVASIEGVAAMGLFLRLRGVQSPFVPARHILPVFTLAALGYELYTYLSGRQSLGVSIGATVFVLGLFGSLFWLAFRTLENLFIDPVQAAEERVLEDMRPFLERAERFNAESRVVNEANVRIRAAEQERYDDWQRQLAPAYLPQLEEVNELRSLLAQSENATDSLRRQVELLKGELERERNEWNATCQDWTIELEKARQPKQDDLLGSLLTKGAQPEKRETVTTYSSPADMPKDVYADWVDAESGRAPANSGPVLVAPVPEPSRSLEAFLMDASMTAEEARAAVKRYTDGTASGAYRTLKMFGYLPEGLTLQSFGELFKELMRDGAADEMVQLGQEMGQYDLPAGVSPYEFSGTAEQWASLLEAGVPNVGTFKGGSNPKQVATVEGDAEVARLTADGLTAAPAVHTFESANGEKVSLVEPRAVIKPVELTFQGDGTEVRVNGIEVPASEMCGICGKTPISASDKSVSRRAFWRKRLEGKDACDECREERR